MAHADPERSVVIGVEWSGEAPPGAKIRRERPNGKRAFDYFVNL